MQATDADKQLAAALGRVPSGIFILTVRRGNQETGMLASWVQQCSFKPPRVVIALQPGREFVKLLEPGTRLTVNILEASQTDMIAHFGKGFALADNAFEGLDIERHGEGAAVLKEALAYLECRYVERFPAGDHDLFLAEITAGALLDEGQPMVHIRKNGFHY
jgi:flavin reductase (DIM6/NTAB) family NADH-FMN oxidoreductase RutF